MYSEPRLNTRMTLDQAIDAVAHKNPDAKTVCRELVKNAERIDPDNVKSRIEPLKSLDQLDIRGYRISNLFEACDKDIVKILAILRALQLGNVTGINREAVAHWIDERRCDIDLDEVIKLIKKQFPGFGRRTKVDRGLKVGIRSRGQGA